MMLSIQKNKSFIISCLLCNIVFYQFSTKQKLILTIPCSLSFVYLYLTKNKRQIDITEDILFELLGRLNIYIYKSKSGYNYKCYGFYLDEWLEFNIIMKPGIKKDTYDIAIHFSKADATTKQLGEVIKNKMSDITYVVEKQEIRSPTLCRSMSLIKHTISKELNVEVSRAYKLLEEQFDSNINKYDAVDEFLLMLTRLEYELIDEPNNKQLLEFSDLLFGNNGICIELSIKIIRHLNSKGDYFHPIYCCQNKLMSIAQICNKNGYMLSIQQILFEPYFISS
jgi:hypothetical protein